MKAFRQPREQTCSTGMYLCHLSMHSHISLFNNGARTIPKYLMSKTDSKYRNLSLIHVHNMAAAGAHCSHVHTFLPPMAAQVPVKVLCPPAPDLPHHAEISDRTFLRSHIFPFPRNTPSGYTQMNQNCLSSDTCTSPYPQSP